MAANANANLNAELDVNHFVDQASDLLAHAGVNTALIYNNSGKLVTFEVYNYIDNVNWVPAQKTLIADHYCGSVAASGSFFKIHPNGNSAEEFLVAPHKAYIYDGPGKLRKV